MATLLVLGSKPDPALPPRQTFDAVACANASGFSAAKHGLPDPVFTVMSAILTSGRQAPNRLALQALSGLCTGTLYFYPRPEKGGPVARRLRRINSFRTRPWYFRWKLHRCGYRYQRFEAHDIEHYLGLLRRLCDDDPEILARVADKLPSTGMMALVLGIAGGAYSRYIISGFSFEITHAYADNPLVAERGTTQSKHADTDMALLRHLADRFGTVYTTEQTVHERVGVPLFTRASVAV